MISILLALSLGQWGVCKAGSDCNVNTLNADSVTARGDIRTDAGVVASTVYAKSTSATAINTAGGMNAAGAIVAGTTVTTGTGGVILTRNNDETFLGSASTAGVFKCAAADENCYISDGTRWARISRATVHGGHRYSHTYSLDFGVEMTTPAPLYTPTPRTAVSVVSAAITAATLNIQYVGANTRTGINLVTSNVSGNTAYVTDSGAWIKSRYGPRIETNLAIQTAITSRRIWFGWSSGNPSGSNTAPADSAMLRYSTNASDTVWQFCTSDATTASCTSTTVTVAADTDYSVSIECLQNGATCYATVNGTTIKKTTNLPTTTVAMFQHLYVETLTTATANVSSTGWITGVR